MSVQQEQRRTRFRGMALRGILPTITFLVLAALFEYLVVLYAIGLGLKDASLLQWSFNFPGTSWPATLTISPIFHLVPLSVIIALAFSWKYLMRRISLRRQDVRKGRIDTSLKQRGEKTFAFRIEKAFRNFNRKFKSRLLKSKTISKTWQRIYTARATIKSALIVFLAFGTFTLLFSVLAYPQIIYRTVTNAYQSNPGLLSFVSAVNDWTKAVAETVAPIGWIGTAINNALRAAAPGIRDAEAGLGGYLRPLATLDNAGKYLVFQNAAIWISVIIILIYAERMGKGHKYKK